MSKENEEVNFDSRLNISDASKVRPCIKGLIDLAKIAVRRPSERLLLQVRVRQ